jgi:cell division protein FtsI (penicillin-binding protein 3)
MMKPYLVEEVRKSGLAITTHTPEVVVERICSEATLRQLKTCLEGVMVNGTGKALKTPYYKIAGKTGTALVANGNRGYGDHIYQASFAGYFPAEKPVYSCIVVIKNKAHALKYYGGAVAGPVFREIADKLFASQVHTGSQGVAGLPKSDSAAFFYTGTSKDVKTVFNQLSVPFTDSASNKKWTSVVAASDYAPLLKEREINTAVMPDVKGMGLKDALYLLEGMDMKVLVKGTGKVKTQSVEAGKFIEKNQSIVLLLN